MKLRSDINVDTILQIANQVCLAIALTLIAVNMIAFFFSVILLTNLGIFWVGLNCVIAVVVLFLKMTEEYKYIPFMFILSWPALPMYGLMFLLTMWCKGVSYDQAIDYVGGGLTDELQIEKSEKFLP